MDREVDQRGGADLRLPADMWDWLARETGDRRASSASEAQWFWDRPGPGDTRVGFSFRDPDAALRFKLTWG